MSIIVKGGTSGILADVTASGELKVSVTSSTGTTDTELPAAAALTDTTANPTAPMVGTAGMVWNGSTWERVRSPGAVLAAGSGTGLLAAGLLGHDGTNYQRIKTDTGGNQTAVLVDAAGTNKVAIGTSGGLSVKGSTIAGTSASIAAAGTGTIGPVNVSEAGNVTFIVKNTTAASAYAGAPVLVFEQSDDNVSWGAMVVVRNDTQAAASTFTLSPNAANAELMLDGACEGVNWVRCRVTTGPATNAMTVVIQPGGLAFTPVVTAVASAPGNITGGGPSSVTAAATDTLIAAANANRKAITVYNDSSALLYLSLGTNAASTTAFTVRMSSQGYYEVPDSYTGQIRGIWSAATGAARVTEVIA